MVTALILANFFYHKGLVRLAYTKNCRICTVNGGGFLLRIEDYE